MSSSRKSLSGATLGMRFMKRKVVSTTETDSTSQSALPQHKQEDIANESSSPIKASKLDMYGVSGVITGRRSFNKFNKVAGLTWDKVLKSRKSSCFGSKIEKQHISDQELFERYENHMIGKGRDITPFKDLPIQNLKRKRNQPSPR